MYPEGAGSKGRLESVEGYDGEGDGQQDLTCEKGVGDDEGLGKKPVPTHSWMCCSEYAQAELQDDDIDDENANIREDQGCDGEAHIHWSSDGRQSQHVRANTRHAETKHGP